MLPINRVYLISPLAFVVALLLGFSAQASYFKVQPVEDLDKQERILSNLKTAVEQLERMEDAPVLDDVWPLVIQTADLFVLNFKAVDPTDAQQLGIVVPSLKTYFARMEGKTLDVLTALYLLRTEVSIEMFNFSINGKDSASVIISLSGRELSRIN